MSHQISENYLSFARADASILVRFPNKKSTSVSKKRAKCTLTRGRERRAE
jgi:hypothetical protein